jgi:tetratricopeptide (TPR) repeat protein
MILGALAGFIAGYMIQERMGNIQPLPRIHGETAPQAAQAAPEGLPAAGGAGAMPAIQALQQRLAENPDDADALLELANLNFDIANWQRARDLYQRYLILRPENVDATSDLGICFRALKQFDEALASFEKAAAMAPDHFHSRFYRAVVLGIDMGDVAAAEAALPELRTLQPGSPDVERLAEELARRRQG